MKHFNEMYDAAVAGFPTDIQPLIRSSHPRAYLYYMFKKCGVFVPEALMYIVRTATDIYEVNALDPLEGLPWLQKSVDTVYPATIKVSHVTAPLEGVAYLAVVEFPAEAFYQAYTLPNGEGSVEITAMEERQQIGMYSLGKGFTFMGQEITNAPLEAPTTYTLYNMERV